MNCNKNVLPTLLPAQRSGSEEPSKLIPNVARSLVLGSEILPREFGAMVAHDPERVII